MDMGISSQAETGKLCSKCGVTKPLSEFYTKKTKKGTRYYHSRCRDCTKSDCRGYYGRNKEKIKVAVTRYYADNKETYRVYQREYQYRKHREWKRAALAVYGEKCACCGESKFEFLTIDHVNNDGHAHRREISGRNTYEWLAKVGYRTKYELQTLCFNCNFAKRYNGTCPHKVSDGSTTIPIRGVHRKRGGSAEPL